MVKIFAGNLSFQTTQDELTSLFTQYGTVDTVSVVTDRMTGQARGFAFVEMADAAEADAAMSALNGTELNGRTLNVNEARPKTDGPRPGGGGGGFKRGGNGGGGNRDGGSGGFKRSRF